MPIYPYSCEQCGHEFEVLQKISEDPLKECPQCGQSSLRKRLTAPAFHLKGTGWYETDFKNAGKDKDTKDKSEKAGSEGKKEDKKSEKSEGAKTSDTKTETKPTASKPAKQNEN